MGAKNQGQVAITKKNMNLHFQQWEAGKKEELRFWHDVIFNTGVQPQAYHDELMGRLAPRPFRRDLAAYLPVVNEGTIRVLDVAAGPISVLGSQLAGQDLEIVAIDALADGFNKMLVEAAIQPPVTTQFCEAEKISERFPESSFDLALIRNALDHCYDPIAVINSVFKVLKPNGALVIEGFVNEAEFENYAGLHQWNIDYRGGQLTIFSKTGLFEIPTGINLSASLSVPIYDPKSRWIKAVLRKPLEE
jgi:SAM-dependent methyltransferase